MLYSDCPRKGTMSTHICFRGMFSEKNLGKLKPAQPPHLFLNFILSGCSRHFVVSFYRRLKVTQPMMKMHGLDDHSNNLLTWVLR